MAVWDSSCLVEGAATFKCFEPLFTNVVVALTALVGIALFIIYILFAIFAHTDCLHFANALGGLTENERAAYFARFRYYFVWKTTCIVLLMSIAFFERFSFLQYIQNKIKTT